MPDPTPEERAVESPLGFVEWLRKEPLVDACFAFDAIVNRGIRAAVAAETERCAKRARIVAMEFFREAWIAVDETRHPQTALEDLPGWGKRAAAAIRREGEDEDG